jgi:ubiquitin conjugation factor E4 B
MMLNDVVYFLDEALTSLPKIKKIETDKLDVEAWERQSQEDKEKADKELKQLRNITHHSLRSGDNIMQVFKLLTDKTPGPFISEELVDRMAQMLNYVLSKIAGPSCMALKVSNPEKIGFKPKEMLTLVTEVIVNLTPYETFGRVSLCFVVTVRKIRDY